MLVSNFVATFSLAIALTAAGSTIVAADEASTKPAADQADQGFKHHDGSADGKKSLGGSGEMLHFSLPNERKIAGIKIHGSRYGLSQPPQEKFLIYFLNHSGAEVLSTQMAPYSSFERGEEQWVTIRFRQPIEVPKTSGSRSIFAPTNRKARTSVTIPARAVNTLARACRVLSPRRLNSAAIG